jgi:hypothetical protein
MTAALRYTSVGRARRHHALARLSTNLVTDLLAAAEKWADHFCDREFDSKSRTEYHRGGDSDHFWTKCVPITSITSITVTDESGTDTTLTVSGSTPDVIYNADTGRIQLGPNNSSGVGYFPSAYDKNIAIVYTAGYAAASMPDDLQEAVIIKAFAEHAKTAAYMNAGLASENIGGAAMTRITGAELRELVQSAEALLTQYRRLE